MPAALRRPLPSLLLIAAFLGCPAFAAAAPDAPAKPASKYLRIERDEQEPVALQTSVVTFRPQGEKWPGATVDLIGAVHVADGKYYERLNEIFKQYDALLYELVAPDEDNIPREGQSKHPVGQMQQGLKSMLDLQYQLEAVDYTRPNFVHADMSPEEFSRVMRERGESFLQLMLRMMGQALATQRAEGRGTDADLLLALFSPNRSLRLKRIMATQFEDLEGSMQAIEGPNGSTLIGQRNKKALAVLERELGAGKKRIGIFYGAGHMPDMATRLQKRFELAPDETSVQWLTAWDMSGDE